MTTPPLEGVRVLDLSRLLPGPFASQILCDLGAEVIKIEDTNGGDYTRYFPPFCEDGTSAAFHALNRGKKSIVLNLKKDKDRQRFLSLVRTAHVVVETFRPGVMDRLGIGSSVLLKQNPALLICSISGYGQTGPDRHQAGHDLNYLARAGVLGMLKKPAALPVQVADICAGSYPAVVQILAGLRRAEKTGKGSVIDVSMAGGSYALLAMAMAKHAATGEEVGAGKDWLSGEQPCYRVYPTKDGHISVGALEPKFWLPLVKVINKPHLADKQFASGDEGEVVLKELEATFSSRTNREWKEIFKGHDCCVEIVSSPEEALKDAQLAASDLNLTVEVQGKQYNFPKTPLKMNGVTHATTPGPGLGEHTAEVLASLPSKL